MRAALALCLSLSAVPALAQDSATDCDRVAGYDHTPRLIGLPGVAQIADPAAAVAACAAAAFAPGADPFLNLLLARALEAADPQDLRLPGLVRAGGAAAAPFATSRMARLHVSGAGGLAADPAMARTLEAEACAAFPDRFALAGCNNLAAFLIDDRDNPAQRGEGFALLDRTCKAGLIVACINQAEHATYGTAGAVDLARAFGYWSLACELGHALACSHAGYAQEYGEGVGADPAAANGFYRRSCDLGSGYGCYGLAENLSQGIGGARDWAGAQALMDQACGMGEDNACYDLSVGLYYGMDMAGPVTPEGQARAIAYFTQSCADGGGRSCTELGYIHQNGVGVPQDQARALEFHIRACELGDLTGCNNLGAHYALGQGVAADMDRGIAYYRQACDGGLGLGCFNLGEVLTDPQAAGAAFARACDLGHTDGCAASEPAAAGD